MADTKKFEKGNKIENKVEVVFEENKENSKEHIGKQYVISVLKVVDKDNKKARINVLNMPDRFKETDEVLAYLPMVVLSNVLPDGAEIVNSDAFIYEYKGMTKSKNKNYYHDYDIFDVK